MALTPAGERLRRHAALILVRLAAARADVTRAVAAPGRLIVALTPLAGQPWVTEALDRVRAGSARLRTTVRLDDRDRVLTAVATGEADLGLVDGFTAPSDPLRLPDAGGPRATGVAESPAVVAVPRHHPLARRRAVDLGDLADASWIDAPGVTPFARLPVDGPRPGLRYDGADVALLTALVAAGHGLAVLPGPVVATYPGLVGVPVGAPRLVHRVEMVVVPGPGGDEPADRLAALLSRAAT